jgi:hypothetical protein
VETVKPPIVTLPVRSEMEIYIVRFPDGSIATRRVDELATLPPGAVVESGARRV